MKSRSLLLGLVLCVCVGLLYGASKLITSKPLDVDISSMGQRERDLQYAKLMRFTQPAIGGMLRFGDHCSACHGRYAEGGEQGPSLLDQSYSVDFRNRELFHSEMARSIPQHQAVMEGGQKDGPLDFNSVEMLGKFLRELRRKGPPPPAES